MIEGVERLQRSCTWGVNLDLPSRAGRRDRDRARRRVVQNVALRGSWFTSAFERPDVEPAALRGREDRGAREPGARRHPNDGRRRGAATRRARQAHADSAARLNVRRRLGGKPRDEAAGGAQIDRSAALQRSRPCLFDDHGCRVDRRRSRTTERVVARLCRGIPDRSAAVRATGPFRTATNQVVPRRRATAASSPISARRQHDRFVPRARQALDHLDGRIVEQALRMAAEDEHAAT